MLRLLLLSGLLAPLPALAQEAPPHEVSLVLTEGTWMSVDVHRSTVVFDLLGDIWSVPLNGGGEATRLTHGAAWDGQPRFSPDGRRIAYVSDADGTAQLWVMKPDGSGAHPVTHETHARLAEPSWDPEGSSLLARRFPADAGAAGGSEIWLYPLDGGAGTPLTALADHPHAGEAWAQDGQVWFSSRRTPFAEGGDPVAGLWSVERLQRKTGAIRPVIVAGGSAARPVPSPDGRLLAFVSRDQERTLLELLEVSSGKRRVLADWLSTDQMEGPATQGVYPSFDWTADGSGVVLWARGKLWRVDLLGGREEIPFHAAGSWPMQASARPTRTIPDTVATQALRWPVWGPDGKVVFSAMGALWMRSAEGALERLSPGSGYAPAWRPDGSALAWTAWEDPIPQAGGFSAGGGALLVATFGWRGRAEALPLSGQLVNPTWSPDGRQLAVLRGVGGAPVSELTAAPWYEVVLLTRKLGRWAVQVVDTLESRGSQHRAPRLYLYRDRVWFFEDRAAEAGRAPSQTVLVSLAADGSDRRDHLILPWTEEAVPSPDFTRIAWRIGRQLVVSPLDLGDLSTATAVLRGEDLPRTALPESVGAGDWLSWTLDGTSLAWSEGHTLYTQPVDQPDAPPFSVAVDLEIPRQRPTGTIALVHARVITMEGAEIVEDATVVITQDRIAAVTPGAPPPPGAEVIDCTGMTVIPGLIDVNARGRDDAADILPTRDWRLRTALDFGVTTLHDPVTPVDVVSTQAARVAAGELLGPRLFTTGTADLAADDATHAVARLKALGAVGVRAPATVSRAEQQALAGACRAADMLCVVEGGDLWQVLSAVADGYAAVEQPLPTSPIYADVLQWWAASGAAWAPSLLAPGSGLGGASYYFQYENPTDSPRLLRHHPRRLLDRQAWRRPVLARDWSFQSAARDAAALSEQEALLALGTAGQLPGLGVHWELWTLAGPGAMTPHQALRAATIDSARYLGLQAELGSIVPGKLADLVILTADPLADIRNTTQIALVIQNGAVLE